VQRRLFPLEASSNTEACSRKQLYSSVADRRRETDTSFPWPFRTCAKDIPREREALRRIAKMNAHHDRDFAKKTRIHDLTIQAQTRLQVGGFWKQLISQLEHKGPLHDATLREFARQMQRPSASGVWRSKSDHALYQGSTLKGFKHGRGVQRHSDGTVERGRWAGGVMMGAFEIERPGEPLARVTYATGKVTGVVTAVDAGAVGALLMRFV